MLHEISRYAIANGACQFQILTAVDQISVHRDYAMIHALFNQLDKLHPRLRSMCTVYLKIYV